MISAPVIIINNPESTLMRTFIKLVTKQIYNFGIVNYNPCCTCTQTGDFSPRVGTGMVWLSFHLFLKQYSGFRYQTKNGWNFWLEKLKILCQKLRKNVWGKLKFVFYKLFENSATRWEFLWSKIISNVTKSVQIFYLSF